MLNKSYITDRLIHWISAILLVFMLMNLSTQLHNINWDIKGQLLHRQDAVEAHAEVGLLLIALTILRLLFTWLNKAKLKRMAPRSKKHALMIKGTHIALYVCLIGLAITGLAMINHYEIPLTVLGVELPPEIVAFYDFFPKVHQIHMLLKQAIWWLLGIHILGVVMARR
ncbi:cytochrome b/b6 domain-containing protein [Marisediminitalea sp.]|uniref:cytochrome b/b6 domain-containing protein n=1 Tax=Marisediminitalea sp. TaxID=2662268 RepID=UPI003512276D